MGRQRPTILGFSVLAIVIWIAILLVSLGVYVWASPEVQRWVPWAAGILVVAVDVADKVWPHLTGRKEPEPQGGA